MALADELLAVSRALKAASDPETTQASLRRSVSTAYYAAFQLLLADASIGIAPPGVEAFASRIARAFTHVEMKQICRAVQNGSEAFALRDVRPAGFSADIRLVASEFIQLQDARHKADYDTSLRYTGVQVQEVLDRAASLFEAWERVRTTEEAGIFCAALLLGTRWAK